MNAITPFYFEQETIRVILIGEEPWWVASDVAKVLGYTHTPHLTRILDDDEKGVHNVDPLYPSNTPRPGGEQGLTIISESGLFAAILKSRKPEAKRFRRWVTGEVLPSLRRTGRYAMPGDPDPPQLPSPALDDAALPRLTAAIGIMREARHVWGREECRRIWVHIGLPSPIAEADGVTSELARKVAAATHGQDTVMLPELAQALGVKDDARTSLQLGAALRLLGWESRRGRVGGALHYVWRRASQPAARAMEDA